MARPSLLTREKNGPFAEQCITIDVAKGFDGERRRLLDGEHSEAYGVREVRRPQSVEHPGPVNFHSPHADAELTRPSSTSRSRGVRSAIFRAASTTLRYGTGALFLSSFERGEQAA